MRDCGACLGAAGAGGGAAACRRRGAMVQAVWFDGGERAAGRLLLSIHHLSVDGVSWRILVPDLAAAWSALARGRSPALAGRGTSFRRWAQRLLAHAQDAGRVEELAFWRGMLSAPSLSPGRWRARCRGATSAGTAGHLTLDAAGSGDGGAADAGSGGVPRRDQRCAADRAGGCGCGVVPAARPGGRARRCWWIWRGTGGRRFSPMWTSRARWAGSPAFIRCGWMPGGIDLAERYAGGLRSAGRSRASRSSCARSRTMGWATGCCAISTGRPARS